MQAFVWIKALKLFELSVAHMITSLCLILNLVFANVFFDEKISNTNIIGSISIFFGVIILNFNSKLKKG